MEESKEQTRNESVDMPVSGALPSNSRTVDEGYACLRPSSLSLLQRLQRYRTSCDAGVRGTSEGERRLPTTENPSGRIEGMETESRMVSRRNHTRNNLRRVKKCYHPSGNFVDKLTGKTFDFIFEEFSRDPSLPVKFIPTLAEILYLREYNFKFRHGRERLSITPVTTNIDDKPFYSRKMLETCCELWNLVD